MLLVLNSIGTGERINTTGTFTQLSFTASAENSYNLAFYLNKACPISTVNGYFEVDNVLVSYEEETIELRK